MTISIQENGENQKKSAISLLSYMLFELNLCPYDYIPSILISWIDNIKDIPFHSNNTLGINECMDFLPKLLNSIPNNCTIHVKDDVDPIYDNTSGIEFKDLVIERLCNIEWSPLIMKGIITAIRVY